MPFFILKDFSSSRFNSHGCVVSKKAAKIAPACEKNPHYYVDLSAIETLKQHSTLNLMTDDIHQLQIKEL